MAEYRFKIGDVVNIKSDIDKIFDHKIGIILTLEDSSSNTPGYFVMICGMPNETFWFLEYELELLDVSNK